VRVEPSNIMLCAIKKAEDSDAMIVRVEEHAGRESQLSISWPRPIAKAEKVSIIEEHMDCAVEVVGNTIRATMKPHEIASFLISTGVGR
jgi:alpha-mannosidase